MKFEPINLEYKKWSCDFSCLCGWPLTLCNCSAEIHLPPGAQEFMGLWQNETVTLYLDILKESSNPITVEAAVGAIQNLTACYWKVSTHTAR